MRQTLLDRVLLWIYEWLGRIFRWIPRLPSARSFGLGVIALIVLFILVRVVIAARDSAGEQQGRRRRRGAEVVEDPWLVAERCAARGSYEEAAHALYRGILASLATGERLRLDPSRTSGDYSRELRRRGSPAVTLFIAFTRRFESAVYGHEQLTPAVFAELDALSTPFRPRVKAA